MPKNIVICCDGTGNQFGTVNSNVVKLYSVLVNDPARQTTYYHPGLGTMGAPGALTRLAQGWTRMLGLAFGYGLMGNLGDAYRFLMNAYEPGDRVFLFGFSRGAYTVRALAAMLHMFGLIAKGNDGLIPYAARLFRRRNQETFRIAAEFKAAFSRPCKPHFIGVWDTVSSVGWIYDPLKLPYTAHNPDIAVGRHAVAIDERRCFYRQNLWGAAAPGQDVRQVWFAGVHSDIGGGYPEPESGLSKITLEWMVRESRAAGLLVNESKLERVLGAAGGGFAPPDPGALMHRSLHGFWWLLEFWPKRYTAPSETGGFTTRWRIPRGRPRQIPPGSVIHETVLQRRQTVPGYRPPNLPAEFSVDHK